MKVTFRLARQYAEIVGRDEVEVSVLQAELAAGVSKLVEEQPALSSLLAPLEGVSGGSRRALFIRGTSLLNMDDGLSDGDVIRVMTPISGG